MVKYLVPLSSSSFREGKKFIWERSKPIFKYDSEQSSDGNTSVKNLLKSTCEDTSFSSGCAQETVISTRGRSSVGGRGTDASHCKDTHPVV